MVLLSAQQLGGCGRNNTVSGETLFHILPELVLIATAAALFVLGAFFSTQRAWRWIALGGLVLAGMALGVLPGEASRLAQTEIAVDRFALYLRHLALLAAALLVLTAWSPLSSGTAEYFGCLLAAASGVMLAAGSSELVLLFVGLELVSIPTYAMLYLGRRDQLGQEATVKYFILSILASAATLYGLSFLYGVAGTTRLEVARLVLSDLLSAGSGSAGLAGLALVLVFAGLGLKIAAVPFHFYAPDVYQGTTHANAAFLSVFPKAAGLAALVRIVAVGMESAHPHTWQLAMLLAALSMTVGNVLALWQNHLRRLLAFSSIANAGYMLIGLAAYLGCAAGDAPTRLMVAWDGVGALLLFLLVYAVATIGAFATLAALEAEGKPVEEVDQLAGLAWAGDRRSALGWLLAVFMFSLAGVPPLAGFWGKLSVFASALDVGGPGGGLWFIALAVLGVLNAAIAAAYYLRVVAAVFFRSPERLPDECKDSGGAWIAAVACAVLVVGIGINWQPSLESARRASPGFRHPARQVQPLAEWGAGWSGRPAGGAQPRHEAHHNHGPTCLVHMDRLPSPTSTPTVASPVAASVSSRSGY